MDVLNEICSGRINFSRGLLEQSFSSNVNYKAVLPLIIHKQNALFVIIHNFKKDQLFVWEISFFSF